MKGVISMARISLAHLWNSFSLKAENLDTLVKQFKGGIMICIN